MVVGGRPRSRPSDEDGERAVRNALAVVRDDAYCDQGPVAKVSRPVEGTEP